MQPVEWLNYSFQTRFTSFYNEYAEELFIIYNQLFKDYHSIITFDKFLDFSFVFSDYKCKQQTMNIH